MFLLIISAITGLSAIATADVIPIKRETELRLSYGVDPLTEQVYEQCVETDFATASEDQLRREGGPNSSVNTPVKVEQITSYQEMDNYSAESFSGHAKIAFAQGSFNYSARLSSSLFSDRAAVGIDASADYGRFYLKNVELKPDYRALAERDRAAFYRRCGTEYVSGYRMGQGIRVLMMTSTQMARSFQHMDASFSSRAKLGPLSSDLSGTVTSTARSLLRSGALEVRFYGFGGGELGHVDQILRTQQDAERFRDIIADYAKNLSAEKAVRTHYVTRPYFPDQNSDALMAELKRSTINRLFSDFRLLADTRNRIADVLADGETEFLEFCQERTQPEVCQNYMNDLKKVRDTLDRKVDEVQASAHACLTATKPSECKTRPEDLVEVARLVDITWPASFRRLLMEKELRDIRDR